MNHLTRLFNGQLPELIMYDLDGTLLNSAPDLIHATQHMLNSMKLPPAKDNDIIKWLGNGIPALIKRALANDMRGNEPGKVDESLFSQSQQLFNRHYSKVLGQYSQPYTGVMPFLEAMKNQNITQAIVTNKSLDFSQRLSGMKGFSPYISYILGGDSLALSKPDPLPLTHTIEHFQVKPENALMVGDSKNDVIAAKAAGIKVIGLPYGYNHGEPLERSEPDLIIPDLSQLL
ncbi:Phosphoglycolate phosphatase [invertebrate metagenome]|uniref:phosphoglycolate phosphatase n=1 Tax=invertebrate metagenome TaxID=1711999 RepID=A0A2H9T3I3_9ZZZZ